MGSCGICDSVQGSSAASTTLELPGATVETVAALFCVSVNVNTHRVGNPLVFAIYLVFVLHYRVVAVTKCGGEGKK